MCRSSVQEFITLWDHRATNAGGEVSTGGELFKGHLWGGDEGLKKAGGVANLRRAQKQYFEAQWQDTLGFIGRYTHNNSHTHSLSLTHNNSHTHTITHTHTLSHTHSFTRSLTHSHTLSHTLSHTHTLSLKLSLAISLSLFTSLSLSNTHLPSHATAK